MRVLEAGFASHLASGATTLATCWRIERSDGLVLGFTDHDVALSFDGVGYLPAHGLDGGAGTAKLGAQVDTAEVVGVLHSDAIDEYDILLGRFDGAEVTTWRVNWRAPAERMLVSRTTIGEIVREDGVFRAELRSGQHAINQKRGRIYQALCDVEACAFHQQGEMAKAAAALDLLVEHAADNFSSAKLGLLCAGDGERLAQLIVGMLQDSATRRDMLRDLQIYAPLPRNSEIGRQMDALYDEVRNRPEVKEAVAATGKVLSWPIFRPGT